MWVEKDIAGTTEPRPAKRDGTGELTDEGLWDASSTPVGLAR